MDTYLLNTSGQKYLAGTFMARVKLTREQIVDRFKNTHGDRFDYRLFEYNGISAPGIIVCRDHGRFSCTPDRHFRGDGCPTCSINKRSQSKKLTHEEWVSKAVETHNGFYDYSKSSYVNAKSKITVICPNHGEFEQGANAHIRGSGCPLCVGFKISSKKRKSEQAFVDQMRDRYGDRFDLSCVVYNGSKHPVTLVCREHGEFIRTAGELLQGWACSSCAARSISLKETQWLDSLNVPMSNRQVRVKMIDGSYIIADGFVNNTVYEFWGDYWHGNPNTHPNGVNKRCKTEFKDLYAQTCAKIEKILISGYNLVQIWESEWSGDTRE